MVELWSHPTLVRLHVQLINTVCFVCFVFVPCDCLLASPGPARPFSLQLLPNVYRHSVVGVCLPQQVRHAAYLLALHHCCPCWALLNPQQACFIQ